MHPKIQIILDLFEQINTIPRCSEQESRLRQWLEQWAEQYGFTHQTDTVDNLCIRVPSTMAHSHASTVVLQAHMDMVCEKTADSVHDFSRDPIRCIREGDWLHADQTTLGADNGIGIAIALAIASDTSMAHPPLELLFTVNEETGLVGATHLSPDLLTGRILLNLDSEDEGVLINGCAGGRNSNLVLPLSREPMPDHSVLLQVQVTGLQGGHSGIDINKHLANANRLLARTLDILRTVSPFQLIQVQGGTVHNAIARHAQAWISCPHTIVQAMQEAGIKFNNIIREEFAASEPDILISITQLATTPESPAIITAEQSVRIIDLLLALPHGVMATSPQNEALVETSCNFAVITTQATQMHILISQRSSVWSQLDELTNRINAIAALADAQVQVDNAYPAWQPNWNSPLLSHCQTVYRSLFGNDPIVQVIHAGLETGLIGDRYPNMDMISLGPTILNPHSPEERLFIPSVGKVWDFLVALLSAKSN